MRYFKLVLIIAGVMELMECQILRSNVEENQPIYPGEEIIFSCQVESPILAWGSEEYIGPGGAQLTFVSIDDVGYEQRSVVNPSTYAELVYVMEFGNHTYHLLSELHIVTTSHRNASVSCIDVGTGSSTFYHFVVNGIPDPTVNCTVPRDGITCPDEPLSFTCLAIDSVNVAWQSNEYIGTNGEEIHFSIHEHPGTVKRSIQNPNTVAMLLKSSYEKGLPILQCQLNITVSPTILKKNQHSITCLNAGLGTSEIFSFRKKDACESTTKQETEGLVTVGINGSSSVHAALSNAISALFVIVASFG